MIWKFSYHILYQLSTHISPRAFGPWADMGISGWYGVWYETCHIKISIYQILKARALYFQTRRFLNFVYRLLCKKVWPFHLKGQGQPKIMIFSNFLDPCLKCCIASPRAIAIWFRRRRFLKCYTIYAWWPLLSCDLDALNKFLFLYP